MKKLKIWTVIYFIFLNTFFSFALAQENSKEKRTSFISNSKKTGQFLLNGIIHSRYKKPGWREYVLPDYFEIPPANVSSLPPHPRLITRNQILSAKTHISQEPFARWYALMLQFVNRNSSHDLVREKTKKLKAFAFIYHLESNPAYLSKAIQLFTELPEAPKILNLEGGMPGTGWGDYLQAADAIPDLCAAYDLLYNELPVPIKVEVKRKTLSVVQQLLNTTPVTPRNNHVTVFMIATATAAITFENTEQYLRENNQELYNESLSYLSQSLALIAPDGGYGEGPGYSQYILQYLAQFSVYQKNCFGHNLFDNPRLERMVNWQLDNYKGTGSFSQFDDAHFLNKFYLPLIFRFTSSGNKWEDAFTRLPEQKSYQTNMVEALYVYKNKSVPQFTYAPKFAGSFYPDLGQYIFHDQTPVPNFYFSLLGENERWFSDVHEHIDPMSFELSAFGEDFIINGGYGRSTSDRNRPYFISPLSNNGILVDGKGVNPNPVSGDPIAAKLEYAFSTSNFGCTVLKHTISDVEITRHVFYRPKAQLVVFDQLEGEKEHRYSIHLNHTGQLMEVSDNQFKIQKSSAQLDVLLMKNPDELWQLRKSKGLATKNGIYEHDVLDIESERKISTELATVYLPNQLNTLSSMLEIPLIKGAGQCFRLIENNTFSEIVFNSADTINTGIFETDAKLSWVSYDGPVTLHSFLLVQATSFKFADKEIKFSSPVTLYFEQDKLRWGGYVEKIVPYDTCMMTFKGFPSVPYVIKEETVLPQKYKNNYIIPINESGKILCGLGAPEVYLPQTFIEEHQYLQTHLSVKDPAYWSPYEKNRFKEEASRKLIGAGDMAARIFSNDIFGNPDLLHHSINVIQGINQYRYNPVPGEGSFRIPHSYTIEKNIGNNKISINENGHYRETGIELLDFNARSVHTSGLETSYRYVHPYHEFKGQQFGLNWRQKYNAGFSSYSSMEENYTNANFDINRGNWQVSPDFHIVDNRLESASFYSRYTSSYLSVTANSLNGEPIVSQTLKGNPGKKFTYILQGNQNQQNNTQKYSASVSASIKSIFHQSNIIIQEDNGWNVENFGLNMNRWGSQINWNQFVNYQHTSWNYDGGISHTRNFTTWKAGAQIYDYNEIENERYTVGRRQQTKNAGDWEWQVAYTPQSSFCNEKWTILQQNQIQVTSIFHTSVLAEAGYDYEWSLSSIGGGASFFLNRPVEFRLMKYMDTNPSLYRFNSTGEIKFIREISLRWLTDVYWQEDKINYAYIRLMPVNAGFQPGLLVFYQRPGTVRLEGSVLIKF